MILRNENNKVSPDVYQEAHISPPTPSPSSKTISGENYSYAELLQLSKTVAKSRATVLVRGAAGTGKKTIAKYIHEQSVRANKNLEVFNAKQFAHDQIEAELKKKLEQALGGTFLIVEMGRMPLLIQQKIYEAIQSGTDIRWIATSSDDLSKMVAEGKFKEDLYYRFNVVTLKVPALVNRLEDIEDLANQFVQKYSKIHEKALSHLNSDVIQHLKAQRWAGNVRELESTIERSVLLCQGAEISVPDVQVMPAKEPALMVQERLSVWKPGKTLSEIEQNVILEALKHFSGNRTHAAKALGISIRTLRNKLAEYRVMGIHA